MGGINNAMCSYGVLFCLISGIPATPFTPERGLRQGGPLSPYLLFLCAEVVIALLRHAEVDGRIHGCAETRNAPMVSHIFFANDTILFSRATLQEADEIKRVLSDYEAAS